LYSSREFGTLPLGVVATAAHGAGVARPLEPFEVCFTHVAQRGAFRRYPLGLLSESRRESMSAMLERVRDPGTYQAFQNFITDAPWSAASVWRHLRGTAPDRADVLILDGTRQKPLPIWARATWAPRIR
jgi:hypothetical protein